MFELMKSHTNLKMGHIGSKPMLLSQITDKPSVRSRGNIFSQIIIKLNQNVSLDEISDKFENGSDWVKN